MLSMCAQYFRDIVDVGVEQACQMTNLVEGSHEVTHFNSYRTAHSALNTRLEMKAAKEIDHVRLGMWNKKDGARDAVHSDNFILFSYWKTFRCGVVCHSVQLTGVIFLKRYRFWSEC